MIPGTTPKHHTDEALPSSSCHHPSSITLNAPLQYCSTVSMAHFRSLFQRIFAEPVHSVSSGCQPCHRYTSIRLSSINKAEGTKSVVTVHTSQLPHHHTSQLVHRSQLVLSPTLCCTSEDNSRLPNAYGSLNSKGVVAPGCCAE